MTPIRRGDRVRGATPTQVYAALREAIVAAQLEPGRQLSENELHRGLCELSGHGSVWTTAQRADGHLNRVRRLSLLQPGYLAEMVAEHRLVVDAVSDGDPDAAESALRRHLRTVLSALPAIRGQHPQYFS